MATSSPARPAPRAPAGKRDSAALPDALHRILPITRPRAWIALLALAAGTAAVVVWSFAGSVGAYVEAEGLILHRSGRVVDAVASAGGSLSTLGIAVDDAVAEGQVVARLDDPELRERRLGAEALLEERRAALASLEQALAAEAHDREASDARYRAQLDELEATSAEYLEASRRRLADMEALSARNLVAAVSLDPVRQELHAARRALLQVRRDRDALASASLIAANERAGRRRAAEAGLKAAERALARLDVELEAQAVRAPVAGRVIELKAAPGAVLGPGHPVASIRTGTEALEVLLYVPPADGKRVRPGMPALVTPVTVRRAEAGSIHGTVTEVSPFPSTLEGMIAVLRNRGLAERFSAEGPPYAGRIALRLDPSSASGLAWTSPRGADRRISSGTLASVEIRVRRVAPATLALPLLREWLGVR